MDSTFTIRISTPADLSGAQAAVQAVQAITEKVTVGERTQEQLNASLMKASPAALNAVQTAIRQVIAQEEAAGRSTEQLHAQLERVASVPIEKQAEKMREMREEAAKALQNVATGIGAGFGIGGVEVVSEKLISTVEGIGDAFYEMFKRGVEGNAELEQRTNGLAVSLRQIAPERYLDFSSARVAASRDIDALRAKANELGIDFKSLSETFGVVMPTLVEAGVTKTSQQIDVLIRLQQLATKNGLQGAQAMRDVLDELLGRVDRTIFGKELEATGLTKQALDEARQAGTTADLILSKSSAMAEGAAVAANSYAGTLQTIRNEIDQLEQSLSKPTFDVLTRLMQGAKGGGGLGGIEIQGAAKGAGNFFGDLAKDAEGLIAKVESTPWLQKLLTGSVRAGLSNLPGPVGSVADLAAGSLQSHVEAGITEAKADAGKPHDGVDGLDDPAAAAERRAKRDAEAQEKYEATARSQAAADGFDANKEAEDQDKRNQVVETHIKQLEKLYPQASQEWRRATAENEVAAQTFGKEVETANKALDAIDAKLEKQKDSARIAADLAARFESARSMFPEAQRGSLGGTDDLAPLSAAIRALPSGDADNKAALARTMEDLLRLQADLNHALADEGRERERNTREAERTAAATKRGEDALADAGERAAIAEARAAGHDDQADELQRQHDIREMALRLQRDGVDQAKAQAAAEREVNATMAERNRRQDNHAANSHVAGEHGHDQQRPTISGYRGHPGDAGYAGADTDGYVDRYGGRVPSAAAVRSTLPDLLPRGMAALAGQGIAIPTAAASLAPVFDASQAASAAAATRGSAAAAIGAGAAGSRAEAGSEGMLTLSVQHAARAGDKTAEAAEHAAEKLEGAFERISAKLQQIAEKADRALSQIANQS